jgi:tetratricopeptide (TPR) repeat protein
MKILYLLFFSVLTVLLLSDPTLKAQHKHGPTKSELAKVGRAKFSVSCKPASQEQFDRAVAMLHSFWYEESGKAFSDLARKDPKCAMAHWGVAMSLYHPLWPPQPSEQTLNDGRAALVRARAVLSAGRTAREKSYIDALETFYRDEQLDYPGRVLAYEEAMAQVHARYPQDNEAGVFYALSLLGSAQALPADKTYLRERKAAAILNKVLALEPNHPGVAHYLIHAYDSPALANLALAAARAYAKIAPGVPHALHMPSHIFIRLGLWQESISSNLDSEAAAKDYARKTQMVGVWDQQLHAMDYLIYAYLQLAQDEKAKAVLDELNRILKTSEQNLIAAYTFAAVPARYAIERRQWSEAASLELKPQEFAWDRLPAAKAIVYFARGVGAARQGDVAGARNALTKLEEFKRELTGAKGYDWAIQVEIQRRAVAAWLAHAERNDQEAVSLMRSAADLEDSTDKHPVTPGAIVPARELLADLLIDVGEPAEALKEFEISLAAVPNRFNGLYGAARAAELAGNEKKAKDYYGKLVALCAGECSQRRELQKAKAFLAKG